VPGSLSVRSKKAKSNPSESELVNSNQHLSKAKTNKKRKIVLCSSPVKKKKSGTRDFSKLLKLKGFAGIKKLREELLAKMKPNLPLAKKKGIKQLKVFKASSEHEDKPNNENWKDSSSDTPVDFGRSSESIFTLEYPKEPKSGRNIKVKRIIQSPTSLEEANPAQMIPFQGLPASTYTLPTQPHVDLSYRQDTRQHAKRHISQSHTSTSTLMLEPTSGINIKKKIVPPRNKFSQDSPPVARGALGKQKSSLARLEKKKLSSGNSLIDSRSGKTLVKADKAKDSNSQHRFLTKGESSVKIEGIIPKQHESRPQNHVKKIINLDEKATQLAGKAGYRKQKVRLDEKTFMQQKVWLGHLHRQFQKHLPPKEKIVEMGYPYLENIEWIRRKKLERYPELRGCQPPKILLK